MDEWVSRLSLWKLARAILLLVLMGGIDDLSWNGLEEVLDGHGRTIAGSDVANDDGLARTQAAGASDCLWFWILGRDGSCAPQDRGGMGEETG